MIGSAIELFGKRGYHATAVREIADQIEVILPDDLWPLPTYQEMLFMR